jgi:hypothetical protein
MNTEYTPLVASWAFLVLVVLLLAGYRKIISVGEAEMLHLSDPTESMHQVAIAHKLDVIDKWGKVLTVIAATYGLLLAIGYTYETWLLAKGLGIW